MHWWTSVPLRGARECAKRRALPLASVARTKGKQMDTIQTPKPELTGYNPRAVSGPANPDYRYGMAKQALSTVTADLAWLEGEYETARMLITSAAKLLTTNPGPDATDNFQRAMARFHAMSTRTSAAQRGVDTALKNCLEGEAEQERRSRAYTQSIVQRVRHGQ